MLAVMGSAIAAMVVVAALLGGIAQTIVIAQLRNMEMVLSLHRSQTTKPADCLPLAKRAPQFTGGYTRGMPSMATTRPREIERSRRTQRDAF